MHTLARAQGAWAAFTKHGIYDQVSAATAGRANQAAWLESVARWRDAHNPDGVLGPAFSHTARLLGNSATWAALVTPGATAAVDAAAEKAAELGAPLDRTHKEYVPISVPDALVDESLPMPSITVMGNWCPEYALPHGNTATDIGNMLPDGSSIVSSIRDARATNNYMFTPAALLELARAIDLPGGLYFQDAAPVNTRDGTAYTGTANPREHGRPSTGSTHEQYRATAPYFADSMLLRAEAGGATVVSSGELSAWIFGPNPTPRVPARLTYGGIQWESLYFPYPTAAEGGVSTENHGWSGAFVLLPSPPAGAAAAAGDGGATVVVNATDDADTGAAATASAAAAAAAGGGAAVVVFTGSHMCAAVVAADGNPNAGIPSSAIDPLRAVNAIVNPGGNVISGAAVGLAEAAAYAASCRAGYANGIGGRRAAAGRAAQGR
jgi:hypothetical protein